MKKKGSYIILIFALVFGLRLLLSIAQILAKKNISGLKEGNIDAEFTFTVNNRLQEVINLSFVAESIVTKEKSSEITKKGFTDTLTMLRYNIEILNGMNVTADAAVFINHLKSLIDTQFAVSFRIIQHLQDSKPTESKKATDSLRSFDLSDKVFHTAHDIKRTLEKDLSNTLAKSTTQSSQLSDYNMILGVGAIFGILLLATIILNRHFKQVELIKALEKAKNEAQKSSQIKNQFLANIST